MRLAPIMQAFFTDYLMTQRHAPAQHCQLPRLPAVAC